MSQMTARVLPREHGYPGDTPSGDDHDQTTSRGHEDGPGDTGERASRVPGRAGCVVLRGVSKFYGDVLGINRVNLEIAPGITSLVGPNGAGKTTLMNLIAGLLHPTAGNVEVLGVPASDPVRIHEQLGYCTQYDAFPAGLTGYSFIYYLLCMHGYSPEDARALTRSALAMVKMEEAAQRKIASYSKGMRQRVKLAQAIAHQPRVLLLDEPLNGLDPMARAEVIDLLQSFAAKGRHVIISSHILHEVDLVSDTIVLMNAGYIVAEGDISGVRQEIKTQPLQIVIRTRNPARLAARLLELNLVVEVKLHDDGGGVLVRTGDADTFYLAINRMVVAEGFRIESIEPADDNVQAAYEYLIGREGEHP